jgi:ubiquinone biosynthesis protein COQ4
MAQVRTLSPLVEHGLVAEQGNQPFLLRDKGGDEGGTLGPDVLVRQRDGQIELLPIVHPDRQRPRLDFAKAWHHFSNVLKDKEQTDELISVFDALPWRAVGEAASEFLSSERGRAIYQAEPYLPDILDDHAALRRTPAGSFAHAYCDFMEREGLSAAGMVEASGDTRNGMAMLPDGVEWYGDRLRDTHDLLHILTGYGRDPLGEQCVLAFLYHQRPSPGHLAVAWAGTLLMRVKLRSRAPIMRALFEARRHGKLCPRIVEAPIHELLPLPLDEVRRRFNVPEPVWYNKVHAVWRQEGVDPHAFLAKQEAA